MHENKSSEATLSAMVSLQYSTASRRNPPARPGECTARRSVREVIDDEGTAEPVLVHVPLSRIVLDEHVGVAQVMCCEDFTPTAADHACSTPWSKWRSGLVPGHLFDAPYGVVVELAIEPGKRPSSRSGIAQVKCVRINPQTCHACKN